MQLHPSTVLVAALALLCAACSVQPASPEPAAAGPAQDAPVPNAEAKPEPKEKALEEKDLKPALLRMVDANPKGWANPKLTKEVIDESPLVADKDFPGVIDIGLFSCNLKKKTFVYGGARGARVGGYLAKEGRFVLNERSEWVGEVTNIVHASRPIP